MAHETNDSRTASEVAVPHYDVVAEIYENDPLPGDWMVFAVDPAGGGQMVSAIFSGSDAECRAVGYASQCFRGFERRAPSQWPYR